MNIKLLFTLFVLLGINAGVWAQTGFYVKSVDTSFTAQTGDPVGKGKVYNTGSDNIQLLWSFEATKNPGWESYFCDNNACYGPGVTECPIDKPIILAPGDSAMLDLHHFQTSIIECGMFEVTVWEVGNSANSVTVPYNYNCVSSSDDLALEALLIYPNPTTNYFLLSESVSEAFVTVNNVVGKTVLRYPISKNQVYPVDHLPQGLYIVNIINDKGAILKSTRLKKI